PPAPAQGRARAAARRYGTGGTALQRGRRKTPVGGAAPRVARRLRHLESDEPDPALGGARRRTIGRMGCHAVREPCHRDLAAPPPGIPRPREGSGGRVGLVALAFQAFAHQLAIAAHGLGLLARPPLRRLLVVAAQLHLAEDTFALHLLLQDTQRLIDI